LPPDGGSWEWGEIYIWGGVTWTPGAPSAPIREEVRELETVGQAAPPPGAGALGQRVWAAVSEQYPAASRGGRFAGNPVSPVLATEHFTNFVKVLGIPGDDAVELVEIDATPILVEPGGVASAFELLSGTCSRGKALELVRRHPGLLVGGVRSLKQGASLVTATLVDVLFAGRLLKVLEDGSKDNWWKVAEIESYARIAALFKPVMDILQRRTADVSNFLILLYIGFVPLVAFACLHTLYPGALVGLASWFLSLALWAVGWAAGLLWSQGLSAWVLGAGSWLLGVASWLLGAVSVVLGHWPPGDTGLAPQLLGAASSLFAAAAGVLGSPAELPPPGAGPLGGRAE